MTIDLDAVARAPRWTGAFLLLVLPTIASAEPSAFFGLGPGIPGAISPDGRVIVGTRTNAQDEIEAFRWTAADGVVGLGALANQQGFYSRAHGVSGDGSVIVGETGDPLVVSQPCVWRESNGFAIEELLPPPRPGYGLAHGVSDDGTTIVGASAYEAFRHDSVVGLIGFGFEGAATGASADGGVIVGFDSTPPGHEAFRWTEATGAVVIGDLPGDPVMGFAADVSADGSTFVGYGWGPFGHEAVRWTAATGMVGLGDLPGGSFISDAKGVSADGTTVVGIGHVGPGEDDYRAFVWDPVNGMRDLRQVLLSLGVAEVSDWTLTNAEAVSDDGRVIVGGGVGPEGYQMFYALLDEPVPPPTTPALGPLAMLVLSMAIGATGYALRLGPLDRIEADEL